MTTIYDVAKRAGVSITTVSRVLNDRGQVSEKTRIRVEQA
ncbi:MAG: LacI family DNA-binding transcriptional regulator, partial [Limnochordia bacterium]|nr:LacI family DNA-binding transcriptional regulator [Limnochordia bacterium]